MSGNSSISAAIRKRASGVAAPTTSLNTVVENNTEQRRINYVDIMVNHETRLKDIEVLMKDSLLPDNEAATEKYNLLLKSIEELKNEVDNIKKELNNNSDETNDE